MHPLKSSFEEHGKCQQNHTGRQCCEIQEGRHLNRVLWRRGSFPSKDGGKTAPDKIQGEQRLAVLEVLVPGVLGWGGVLGRTMVEGGRGRWDRPVVEGAREPIRL